MTKNNHSPRVYVEGEYQVSAFIADLKNYISDPKAFKYIPLG